MERKQKKEQKEEAEKHLRLQDQLKSLKKEHFLWQLLNIEKDMEKVNEDLEAETRSREDVLKEQKDYELEESSKRREQARCLKEITLRKKRIANKKSIIDKKVVAYPISSAYLHTVTNHGVSSKCPCASKNRLFAIAPAFLFVFLLYKLLVLSLVTSSFSQQPELLKLKEEVSPINSKTKSKKKELDRKREERGKHDEEIKMLQNDCCDVTERLNNLKGNDGARKIKLANNQLREYHRM
ncbi:hypothetical protein IFM89_035909 [Coptis chinensis]|uniref:Uncharacterized protein n=1 Tax=Coptis chinensis TaxID=261450 RepID=A0A835LKF4_9MAGN|nr:hypothetical protein IFM89_035909 [Coptis chinensis]